MKKPAAPATAYKPSDTSHVRRQRARYSIRLWSVRRARLFEGVYNALADVFLKLHPVWNAIGYKRVEYPVMLVEKSVKSFLFDCRMCGQCALSDTGMSCPMNCPKTLRNGPCGGVRPGGYCEVKPEMRCVWVQAWNGAARMKGGDKDEEDEINAIRLCGVVRAGVHRSHAPAPCFHRCFTPLSARSHRRRFSWPNRSI